MGHMKNPAEQAAKLVANPELYESFASEYSDEMSFYSALRGNAQHSLSFHEYVELRRVFLNRGPTSAIRKRLEERLGRSLKNMVLGNSPRGQAYSVSTLRQLASRRQQFAALNIEVPELLSVVQTTIEHLYDEVGTPAESRETLAELLSAVPADEYAATEYVARAWLTEVTLGSDTPVDRLSDKISRYVSIVPTPEPPVDCERSATAYIAAAKERSFADPTKRQLHEMALHTSPSVETLSGYLYLTAANDIEAYRHGDDNITRADLMIARRHLQLLQTISAYPQDSDRTAYVDSYLHLVNAIEAGGGRWLSARAGKPQPAWWTVTEEYARAAAVIRSANPVRFIKYLSKSFRHAAHATDDWTTRYEIHANVQQLFERLDPATIASTEHMSEEDITSAIAGTLSTHRCRKHEAEAHLAIETPAYEKVHWAVSQARAEADRAPQGSIQLQNLNTIEQFATARQAERSKQFQTALEHYDDITPSDDALKLGITCHQQLCQLKMLVDAGRDEKALTRAHEWFEPESAILAATKASCGLSPDFDSGVHSVSDQFLSIDTDILSVFPTFIRLAGSGGPITDVVQQQLEDCLIML